MPNRIIRDWTMSDKMNSISVHSERFFVRLIMKADDYGYFYADPRVLKASLFPLLLDQIREADISRWTTECQKAGLIVLYKNEGKTYIEIKDFKQRLRQMVSKFPKNDGQSTVDGQREGNQNPEVEGKETMEERKQKFASTLEPFNKQYNREMLVKFFKYWTEPNKSGTKFRQELEKTWELSRRLETWASNDKDFKPPAGYEIPVKKTKWE